MSEELIKSLVMAWMFENIIGVDIDDRVRDEILDYLKPENIYLWFSKAELMFESKLGHTVIIECDVYLN